ncbi:MAG: hypothetical protein KUG58_09725 [Marinosulfonomonas sp.]|nr:hypothetical protein [Marinosulfonomonas sp.]
MIQIHVLIICLNPDLVKRWKVTASNSQPVPENVSAARTVGLAVLRWAQKSQLAAEKNASTTRTHWVEPVDIGNPLWCPEPNEIKHFCAENFSGADPKKGLSNAI